MADINQIVSLGVGSPADIPHFILVGLSPNAVVVTAVGQLCVVDQVLSGSIVTGESLQGSIVGEESLSGSVVTDEALKVCR